MEAHELPIIDKSEVTKEQQRSKKNDRFTKLQATLLIVSTLIISLAAGYFISDQFLWSNDDQNRLTQQLDYYKDMVSKEPNSPQHRVNLGYTYHLNGKSEDAVKQLLMAIDLDKENVSAYFNLGLVYTDLDRYDDALKQATKAVELAPRDFKGHLVQGMVYRELKMYKEAITSLDEANKLMPANTDILFEIGRVAEDQGKIKEAEEIYKEALNYDPLYKPASEALTRLAKKDKDSE
jgi:tetratricopeptide (TPR) repeat protein